MLVHIVPEDASGQRDGLTSQQRARRERHSNSLGVVTVVQVTVGHNVHQVAGNRLTTGEVVAHHHGQAVGLKHHTVDVRAVSSNVVTVDQHFIHRQGGKFRRLDSQHHVVRRNVNVLELHLGNEVNDLGVQLSRVQMIVRTSEGRLRGATMTSTVHTRMLGCSEQGSTDSLDEDGLIAELGNLAAVFVTDFTPSVVASLEGFQQREHRAGQHNRVDGQRVLTELVDSTVRRGAGSQLLQSRFANSEVLQHGRTLDGTHGKPTGKRALAGNGRFHDAGILFDMKSVDSASSAYLTRAGDVKGIVECHALLLMC